MQMLIDLGFEDSATVIPRRDNQNAIVGIEININKYQLTTNILYAVVFGNAAEEPDAWQVRYIGHARKEFRNRMNGYQAPGNTAAVNQRVNNTIQTHLATAGQTVTV